MATKNNKHEDATLEGKNNVQEHDDNELTTNPYYEENQSVSPIHLNAKTYREILDLLEMTNIVCDYYDNEAKANNGEYYGDEKERYSAANAKLSQFLKTKQAIFEHIENIVNHIQYD